MESLLTGTERLDMEQQVGEERADDGAHVALGSGDEAASFPDVAVIIACYNVVNEVHQCLASAVAAAECYPGRVHVVVYEDGSCDGSREVVLSWQRQVGEEVVSRRLRVSVLCNSDRDKGCGAGWARNRAIEACSEPVLMILDADDVCKPDRLVRQIPVLLQDPRALVGGNVDRIPAGSTERMTRWINSLSSQQDLMAHRFRECCIIQPTWVMTRQTWQRAGRYPEGGKAEDMVFFYAHLNAGGTLRKTDGAPVLSYRYRPGSLSFSVPLPVMRQLRSAAIDAMVLGDAAPAATVFRQHGFFIWGAGRDGRKFFNQLPCTTHRRVSGFLDIDPRKIGTPYICGKQCRARVPVIHWRQYQGPAGVVSCVALDRDPAFEANLATLKLTPAVNLLYFA